MSVRIIIGDAREQLKLLPDESVHCIVTSPPYWGLRDYGVDGQIGLEDSPETFVNELVLMFREARRVLRSDGTLWMNLGDSYAGSGRGGNPTAATSTLEGGQDSQRASMIKRSRGANEVGASARCAAVTNVGRRLTRGSQVHAGLHEQARQSGVIGRAWVPPPGGLKQKDLVGIPWMVAFALRADGWYLRQDIIWSKPNPMPESVTDRCTKAHEYIFLLSKTGRYFYDADAIRTPFSVKTTAQSFDTMEFKKRDQYRSSTGWSAEAGAHGNFHRNGRGSSKPAADDYKPPAGANKRSVWNVATEGYAEAHFATFPPTLIEPCILAGCPEGGMVLDPFGGAGTTGLVADRLQRGAILIELNPEYAAMARKRIDGDSPLFARAAE